MVEAVLSALSQSGVYPFHMPGHKRNPAFSFAEHPVSLDVTETTDTDDLHRPTGMLADSMALAARLYGSKEAFLSVGGSTTGLLAAITATVHTGDTVLVARNCHRAVLHGLELAGAFPVWLQPTWDRHLGVYTALSPDAVRQALSRHPHAKLVIVTSPTYEGATSDIAAIAAAAHDYDAVLLVDEAHGAHFGFHAAFPRSAVTLGADIVVQSLHKTLPSPTQTALVHRCSDRVASHALARQLAVVETSSPSYLLLCGADRCLRLLASDRAAGLFDEYATRLARFRQAAGAFLHPSLGDDGKLLLLTDDGVRLSRALREQFLLETEMSGVHHVLAMTSIADTDEGFDRLLAALTALSPTVGESRLLPPPPPQTVLTPREATEKPERTVSLADAVGEVLADELYAYPPGIPLAVPGERVTADLAAYIDDLAENGVTVYGISDRKVRIAT